MRSDMIATASANISAIIIASSIFGAAEGFLPSARIEPYAIAPMTAEGPIMVLTINIIMRIVRIVPYLNGVKSKRKV